MAAQLEDLQQQLDVLTVASVNSPAQRDQLRPSLFHSRAEENVEVSLNKFEMWMPAHSVRPARYVAQFPLYLQGIAFQWYTDLPQAAKGDFDMLKDELVERFTNAESQSTKWSNLSALANRWQREGECAAEYTKDVIKRSQCLGRNEEQMIESIVRGLKSNI